MNGVRLGCRQWCGDERATLIEGPPMSSVPQLSPPLGAADAEAKEQTVWLYQAQQKIYPRSVKGVFVAWRWAFVWLTQLVFYATPWLVWNGRQAVLFDFTIERMRGAGAAAHALREKSTFVLPR